MQERSAWLWIARGTKKWVSVVKYKYYFSHGGMELAALALNFASPCNHAELDMGNFRFAPRLKSMSWCHEDFVGRSSERKQGILAASEGTRPALLLHEREKFK